MNRKVRWFLAPLLLLALPLVLPAAPGDPASTQAPPAETQKAKTPPMPPEVKPGQEAPAGDLPEAVVAEMVFDAGTVNKGDVIAHDFVIENKGKGTLEILRVQASCGCTATGYDQKIEPGKTGKVSAKVNTSGFSGPIHKTINVSTNDPKMATFQLAIQATVKAIVDVQPSENQQLGLVYQGQAQERTFTITATDGTPFEIKSVQAEDPALPWDLQVAPDKKSATLKVQVPADHAPGPINGRFVLATTHPKAETLTLNLFGTIRPPLSVYPPQVTYAGLNASYVNEHPDDINLNKTLTVAYEMGPELEIKEVKSSLKNLTTEVTPITPNQRYSIKLKLNPPLKAGDFEGKVRIETSKGPLEVPVRGKVF